MLGRIRTHLRHDTGAAVLSARAARLWRDCGRPPSVPIAAISRVCARAAGRRTNEYADGYEIRLRGLLTMAPLTTPPLLMMPLLAMPLPTMPPLAIVPLPTMPPLAIVPLPTMPPLAIVPLPTMPPLAIVSDLLGRTSKRHLHYLLGHLH